MKEEIYISVDIEAAGPIPAEYSMLSLGACVIGNQNQQFYIELKPLNHNFVPAALAVSGLKLEELEKFGKPPKIAVAEFDEWVMAVAGQSAPVFVGFNASFDWSFVNWYFHKFLGRNPFGTGALDIKAYYMGMTDCSWDRTRSSQILLEYKPSHPPTHNALGDAVGQGEMFAKLLTAKRPGIEEVE
jgi:ribonuclease T